MTVFEKIEAQQKGHEGTVVFTVGEHLKDICRSDSHCAEIVAQDLDNKSMSIVEAEKKIKAYSDKHKGKASCFCVPPDAAEQVLREFYGLPAAGEKPAEPADAPDILDLSSILS